MKTIAECISKLQEDLQEAEPGKQLQQTYGDEFLSEHDAQRALDLIGLTNSFGYSFDNAAIKNDDDEWRRNYSSQSLQAAWNVAAIIGKVNVDSSYPKYGLVRTIAKLAMTDSNRKTYSNNLLENLSSLDMESHHGVPYIIDDVTYKINKAINEFIGNIQLIPQGIALIGASSALGSLSFINMQKESGDRIASYIAYCKKSEKNNPIVMEESADTDSEASDPSVSNTSRDVLLTDGSEEDDEEDSFFDAISGPEEQSDITERDSDESLYDDAQEESPCDGIARIKIVELVNKFVTEALNNLETRSNETNLDVGQKNYCLQAVRELNKIRSMINEAPSMDSIKTYLEKISPQTETIFAQNRSQTWFRKNISEPFESLKQKINDVLKYCGISMQLPIATTMTLEKYKAFKKEYQAMMATENAQTNTDHDESALHNSRVATPP